MANVKRLIDMIENKVIELVDLLNRPAGEYVPRARRICQELADAVMRWAEMTEFDEEEPTEPRMRLWSAPKPPPIPRKRQETMEIDLNDVIFEEYERRRNR